MMPKNGGILEGQIEKYYGDAVRLRHQLHRFPELGHQEIKTTEEIRQYLKNIGIEILEYSLKTGLVAIIKGDHSGSTLAIREDIDALPILENTGLPFSSENLGISHACGHDIHTAILLLTASVLNEIRHDIHGTILLIFQPAEENCDGAAEMLEAGVLKNHPADQLVGLHCGPSVPLGMAGIISGMNNASCDVVEIEITGRGGHGAHPADCVDPIMAAAFLLTQIQTLISRETDPTQSAVLTFGQILGGTAPNIIPDRAVLKGTLRTLDSKLRKRLLQAIERMAKGCCSAMGTECLVRFDKGIPPLVNDPELTEKFLDSAKKSLGEQGVVFLSSPSMGSDDFSCLLEQCKGKGGQYLIGTREDRVPQTKMGLHQAETIFSDETIRFGASLLCQYAVDTLVENTRV